MTAWSYLIQEISDTANEEAVEKELNDAGLGGWEAVSAWHQSNKIRVLFKKAKSVPVGESYEETIKAAYRGR